MRKLKLAVLFLILVAILTSCESPQARVVSDRLEDLVTVIANQAIETRATAVLREKAPAALSILDTNEDGKLQLAELRELVDSPETLELLLVALRREFLGEENAAAAPAPAPQQEPRS
ncbi:MAG: hypothetical protein KDE27_01865 [Planctomycetes bacterium]|nr:hypothetical protein [Planctomycetota bacterium]